MTLQQQLAARGARTNRSLAALRCFSKASANDQGWFLCYSHYLYPAFLAAWRSGLLEKIPDKAESISRIAKDRRLPEDAVLALEPLLILVGAATLQYDGRMRRGTRAGSLKSWKPMFERHLASDRHVLKQLETFNRRVLGRPAGFWNGRLKSPAMQKQLYDSLDSHSRSTAAVVARELRIRRRKTLVDIGAGAGTYSNAGLAASPTLHAVLVDQSPVMSPLRDRVNDLSRTSFVAANALTERWPAGDTYLLSHFLQDFGTNDRSRLLARAARDLPAGAELWVHGHFWERHLPTPMHAAFGFYLYTHLGGGILSLDTQIAECRNAGFRLLRAVPTSLTQRLLVFARR